jgi:acyl-CoA reductase-like NAD-dependent aldehyde dehydrogenase
LEFFAGFVTEMKGASIPMGPDVVNFSVREPLGAVGRIIPFNRSVPENLQPRLPRVIPWS